MVVLDEVDTMLQMGFQAQVNQVPTIKIETKNFFEKSSKLEISNVKTFLFLRFHIKSQINFSNILITIAIALN